MILLNSLKNLFFSITKKKGISARKPTKNLTPLNVKGPISSIPESCAINVVPQMKQQTNALISDSLFDIYLIILRGCKQNFYLGFL